MPSKNRTRSWLARFTLIGLFVVVLLMMGYIPAITETDFLENRKSITEEKVVFDFNTSGQICFQAQPDFWLTVGMPFNQFASVFRGVVVSSAPLLGNANIAQIGSTISDREIGPFQEVESGPIAGKHLPW